MNKRTSLSSLLGAVAASALIGGCFGGSGNSNTAYVMTNGAAGNTVLALRINSNGTLTQIGGFATGGNGTGITETPLAGPIDGIDPLGSQGSIAISGDGRYLFAVNAGSNTISAFRISGNGSLTLIETEPSGGTSPVSVAVMNNRLYVANVNDPTQAQPSTIVGFAVAANGSLTTIAGSTQTLSAANARPSQVGFSPDGTRIVVTERETNAISTFVINGDGTLQSPVTTASAGPAPFGFEFRDFGTLVVSEAAPGDPAGASASSYSLNANGTLTVITGRVLNGQLASCWTSITPDGDTAIVANTGSHTVTTYNIAGNGGLTVDQAAVATAGAGSAPIDADITSDGDFYVQLLGGTGQVVVYTINDDGDITLRQIQNVGLPALGSQGLVVR